MEEILEYELLNIEWALNYEFDQESSTKMVCDGSGDQSSEKEDRPQIVCDENGIPMGTTPEEVEIRRDIIHKFIQNWRAGNPDPRVYNEELKDFIKVNQTFLIESVAHAAVSYLSTKAVLRMETIIAEAQFVGLSKAKEGNSNQKPFKRMIVMVYKTAELGSVKMTVGVRHKTEEMVEYSITVPTSGKPFIDKDMRIADGKAKKKAPHRK